jgi:hypothetical protein
MLITYNFLVKSKIKRIRTKIKKKTSNIDGVLETSSKIHLGP